MLVPLLYKRGYEAPSNSIAAPKPEDHFCGAELTHCLILLCNEWDTEEDSTSNTSGGKWETKSKETCKCIEFLVCTKKLDGLGPVDNRTSPD